MRDGRPADHSPARLVRDIVGEEPTGHRPATAPPPGTPSRRPGRLRGPGGPGGHLVGTYGLLALTALLVLVFSLALPRTFPTLDNVDSILAGQSMQVEEEVTAGPPAATMLDVLRRLALTREIRVLVDDDELVCEDAERAGFTVVRARWAATSAALEAAQERGRT